MGYGAVGAGHSITAVHGADCDGVTIGAFVSLHSDGF